jgi:CDP-paratose 2-epimerase
MFLAQAGQFRILMNVQKQVLITGGAGFIGTNAAKHFSAKGWKVTLLDNLSRPGSEHNSQHLQDMKIPGMSLVHVDIRDAEAMKRLFSEQHIDLVLHCAAQVAVTSSVEDPLYDHAVNTQGTLNLLEALRGGKNPKAFFIFTSTNKVYGGLEHLHAADAGTRYKLTDAPEGISESHALDFHSPYGCSKGAADQYVRDYARIYGLNTAVFRQSCIYGKHQFGMVDQGWVAYLTMLGVFGKPITIYGDGKQVRDILYVDDLLHLMETAAHKPQNARGEIFNVGGGVSNTLSLLEFLAYLEKRLGKKLDIRFSDWRPGDQKVYISDVRKAERVLGWRPTTGFNQGFDEMLQWIETNKPLLAKFV